MSQLTNNSLITRSSTSILKIIFEIMVLFHHLYVTQTVFVGHVSSLAGPVAVGGFLVLSGFGVGINFQKSGKEYCSKLLKKRIPSIYLMLFITNLCYLFLHYHTGNSFESAFDLIVSVVYLPFFKGFVALSHYIYFLADLIIYYFAFLIFSKIFEKKKNALFLTSIAILILNLLIIAVLTYINVNTGSSRYLRACVCFPIGLLLANFNGQLCKIVDKFKWVLALGLFALGVLIYAFAGSKSMIEYLLPVLFSLFIITAFYGVDIKSKVIDYFAKLVLYVYASHELFRELFIYNFIEVSPNIRLVVVVVLSLVFAIIIHTIVNAIVKMKAKNKTA